MTHQQDQGQSAFLTLDEAGHPGCGMGTKQACFALVAGPGGLQCALISNPTVAQQAGIRLGWRVNVDPKDGLAWCPKQVLKNSKWPPADHQD